MGRADQNLMTRIQFAQGDQLKSILPLLDHLDRALGADVESGRCLEAFHLGLGEPFLPQLLTDRRPAFGAGHQAHVGRRRAECGDQGRLVIGAVGGDHH